MKRSAYCLLLLVPCLVVVRPGVRAQGPPDNVHVPETSIEKPGDHGLRAHTNHLIFIGPAGRSARGTGSGPSGSMVPADLYRAYGLANPTGSGIIAIVDAYDHPNALSDFNAFATRFGLPKESSTDRTAATNKVFQVVYQGSGKPAADTGWAQEIALDIEWAHAMAPNAKILLVECQSNSFANLFAGVQLAKKSGANQVSMSWSSGEFSTETAYDSYFPQDGTVYLAASGDTGGVVQYPACSPNVIAVGGTSLTLGSTSVTETGWSGSGGGTSAYEPKPSFQASLSGTKRMVPDVSSDADPNTGVLVVYNGGLYIFGGTSVSCPCWAGIVNVAGGAASATDELTTVYSSVAYGTNFRDILSGRAGRFRCGTAWDFVTGVGSPIGLGGK